MCGRCATFLAAEAVASLPRTVRRLPNVAPSRNVAPMQRAMVVRLRPETGGHHLDLLRWGVLASRTKDHAEAQRPINCRTETAVRSGLFRGAFKRRLGIMPTDASQEWRAMTSARQPYTIARQDGQPKAFAGPRKGSRWPDAEVTRAVAIATTNANADVAALHNRTWVILEPAEAVVPFSGAGRVIGPEQQQQKEKPQTVYQVCKTG